MSAEYSNDTRSLAEIYSDINRNYQYPQAITLLELLDAHTISTGVDVGCGTGDAIIYLAEHLADSEESREYALYGIDPLPDRIDVAKENLAKVNKQRMIDGKKGGIEVDFRIAGAEDIEKMFGKESMDIIFFNAVIHWVKDQADIMRQCKEVLKPKGRLGFATPSGAHDFGMDVPKQLCSEPPYNQYEEFKPIVTLMTQEEASKLMKEPGLKEQYCKPHHYILSFRNYQEYELLMTSSTYGNFNKFPNLPEDVAVQAREEVRNRLLKAFAKDGKFQIPLYQIFAVAVKE